MWVRVTDGFLFMQADADASYEIQMEGTTEYDETVAAEATEMEVPKDNGEVVSTGMWQQYFAK